MIQKVWIKGNGSYIAHSYGNESFPLEMLAIFLTDMGDLETNIAEFKDPNIGYVIGDQASAERNGDLITIEHQYLEGFPSYTIHQDSFYKILELWQKIFKIKPLRIDMTQEDNKFTFEYDTPQGHQTIIVE